MVTPGNYRLFQNCSALTLSMRTTEMLRQALSNTCSKLRRSLPSVVMLSKYNALSITRNAQAAKNQSRLQSVLRLRQILVSSLLVEKS
jgi:hypothetical protein